MVQPPPLAKQVQTTVSENFTDDCAFSAVVSVHIFLDENAVSLLGVVNRGEPFAKMIAFQTLTPHDAEVVFVKTIRKYVLYATPPSR